MIQTTTNIYKISGLVTFLIIFFAFLHEWRPEPTKTAKEGQREVYFPIENILTYKNNW